MSIFDTLAKMVGGVLQESMMDQIRIESMEDDTTLVMKDGSLISMLNVAGCGAHPGARRTSRRWSSSCAS